MSQNLTVRLEPGTIRKAWPVYQIAPEDIIEASHLQDRQQVPFRDSMVVVAASRLGAATLLTEDLQDGRTISGVRIVNPFAAIQA